jgi:MFS family permease
MVAKDKNDTLVFWGCFIALVTTAFGFIVRMFLINEWADEFGLDPAESGRLAGIGIWPFALSIIGFSLFIDRIGYKAATFIAFAGHIIWTIMAVSAFFVEDKATGFSLLYWGSLVLALGNGTVEAFINPVVATMFSREKTKWLNILHAGWPGGLVLAGVITIGLDFVQAEWYIKVGIIAFPAVVYLFILIPRDFPVSERVASGVSYREMLSEFGVLGAIVVSVLLVLQLMDFFSNGGTTELSIVTKGFFIGIGVVTVVCFGAYTKALGRPLMFLLVLIMMPLATTEIGTDGWITGIMEGVAENFHPGWVLVYTSFIMMVLRFFAGPIVHSLSPLGLLAASAVLAIIGLFTLSITAGWLIFAAATLYALGKTFFWPTMLGVVSEQCPKGGALTLNAISGIGMLAVGTLGFPYIGVLQVKKENAAIIASAEIREQIPGLVVNGDLGVLESKTIYEVMKYDKISDDKLGGLLDKVAIKSLKDDGVDISTGDFTALQDKIGAESASMADALAAANVDASAWNKSAGERQSAADSVAEIRSKSSQGSLASMAVFPVIMLVGYIGLIGFFVSKGGYKPVELGEEKPPKESPPE